MVRGREDEHLAKAGYTLLYRCAWDATLTDLDGSLWAIFTGRVCNWH